MDVRGELAERASVIECTAAGRGPRAPRRYLTKMDRRKTIMECLSLSVSTRDRDAAADDEDALRRSVTELRTSSLSQTFNVSICFLSFYLVSW